MKSDVQVSASCRGAVAVPRFRLVATGEIEVLP